ncbi:hypothetical protein SARC_17439, partial [Sphaeroforma arctica JP610]
MLVMQYTHILVLLTLYRTTQATCTNTTDLYPSYLHPTLLTKCRSVLSVCVQPFVEECLSKGALSEAVKYIAKCPLEERVELYCDAQYFKEAVETAAALNSEE